MSHIHDALKKAEQEKAESQTSDFPALIEKTNFPPEWKGGALDVTVNRNIHAPVASAITAVPSADCLRFDDVRTRCAHPTWHLDPNVNVFLNPDMTSHGAEQFRTLRTRLDQLRTSQQLKTILVTSSLPHEGKTFVTTNLVQAIVQQPDRRVLVIDGDLRRARLHVTFGAPFEPGLSEYLRGEADEMAVIQHGQEGNLCLIAGGKEVKDPSELLSNGRFKMLLDRLTPVFDWVIVDSPPCLPVADATILSSLCDGILLIVRAGVTQTEVAQRACQELSGKKLIGAVLNGVDESPGYGSYYYQPYGHGENESQASKGRQSRN